MYHKRLNEYEYEKKKRTHLRASSSKQNKFKINIGSERKQYSPIIQIKFNKFLEKFCDLLHYHNYRVT